MHPDCKVHGFVQQKFTLQAGEEANHIFYNNAHTVPPKIDLICRMTLVKSLPPICAGWGGHLFQRFCSPSSPGCWAVLQLSCCPSKQGPLSENSLQNLSHDLMNNSALFLLSKSSRKLVLFKVFSSTSLTFLFNFLTLGSTGSVAFEPGGLPLPRCCSMF